MVLVLTQILGGAGVGAGVAIAALSATRLSGSDVVGGLALMCTAGGAALTAASTARIAVRAPRRSALLVGYLSAAVGAVAAAVAVEIRSWPLLLLRVRSARGRDRDEPRRPVCGYRPRCSAPSRTGPRNGAGGHDAGHRHRSEPGRPRAARRRGHRVGRRHRSLPGVRGDIRAGRAGCPGRAAARSAAPGRSLSAATDVPPPASRPSRYWTPHARLARPWPRSVWRSW